MQARDLLTTQNGLISRKQALDAGMSASQVSRVVAAREWVPLFPGVYRHAATPLTSVGKLHGALLWLGPTAVVSGLWAAWWHELRQHPTGRVSVTVPRASTAFQHPLAVVRRRDLAADDICEVRGVRATTRALTALESVRLIRGQDVFDRALQKQVPVAEMADTILRLGGATGVTDARGALHQAHDGTVSPPERELAAALREAGLFEIRAGVRVTAAGRWCWLDFAVTELRLAIEVDGVVAHTAPAAFRNDRVRQNALVRDGWTVLRYTPHDIRTRLAAVVAEIADTMHALRIR